MSENHLFRWFFTLLIVSFLFTTCTDGRGFGRGGGGGFKGGSRGGSKGAGVFGGSSSYNRVNNYGGYNNMRKPSSGNSFKKNAMSFGAGALGGVAAYSLMRSMSHSYRPGYYAAGYGTGETCTNNADMNGTRFGQFRCPLNGFNRDAKYCCGDYGEQYCCARDYQSSRSVRSSLNWLWICLIVGIVVIVIILLVKRRRDSYKDTVMVPVEPPFEEERPAFYQPPPQINYPSNVNPYEVPPQNFGGPYPPQQQMPYPPHQQPYNPYQVKEAAPPNYNDAVNYNQMKPT